MSLYLSHYELCLDYNVILVTNVYIFKLPRILIKIILENILDTVLRYALKFRVCYDLIFYASEITYLYIGLFDFM